VIRDGDGVSGENKLDARVILVEAVEFIDRNDNCRIDESDRIVNRVPLKDLVWSAVVRTDTNGGTFYVITVSSSNGWFTFTFVVSAARYTIGSRVIPFGTRLTMEANYPWQRQDSKLLLVFKVIVAGGLSVDAPNANTPGQLNIYNAAGTAIGSFNSDNFARVGADGSMSIIFTLDGETTDSDRTNGITAATYRSFTLRACVDMLGSFGRLVYDPVLAPSDFTPSAPANAAVSSQPQVFLAVLMALLCAALRQF
jgi:hypothetical protein